MLTANFDEKLVNVTPALVTKKSKPHTRTENKKFQNLTLTAAQKQALGHD